MAGSPLAAMALIGLGYRSLSMSAAAIGPVKAMIMALDAGKAAVKIEALLEHSGPETHIRRDLEEFAIAEGVPL